MTRLLIARINLFITFLQLSVGSLDEFLNYYETLHHEDFRHQIRRRDLYTKNPIERAVEFDTHGKHFRLILHKNTSVLSSGFKVSVVDRSEKRSAEIIDTTIYKGYLDDAPSTSSVSAYWDDDQQFTATISTESDTFLVEPSSRYLPDSPDYTLISYRGSDMKHTENSVNQFCGVVSPSVDYGKPSDAKDTPDGNPDLLNKDRTKRSIRDPCPKSLYKTCPVLLVADFRFHQFIGGTDVAKTAKYMILVMDRVDRLFRRHTFGDCGDGFGFVIQDIIVHEGPTPITPMTVDHYNRVRPWISSNDLLASFSTHGEKDYVDYCLVHLFTATRFETGVLGLAELARADTIRSGGICSGSKKHEVSRNVAWTTFKGRNGERVLSEQAFLVVAHEFGHSWGSGHEFPNSTVCNPGKEGKYLMFVNSVDGREPNNRNFSKCSISAIRDVLVYKANLCFIKTDKSRSFCGNYDLEVGEQCDEGPGTMQPCCDSFCRLRPGKECSDLHHSCCKNCHIANASEPCREPNVEACSVSPVCDGSSSSCPVPAAKPDGDPCEEQGVCVNKTCIPFCKYNNKTQCFCDSVELSCRICCRNSPNLNDTCEPYQLLNETMDFGNVSDNTPCPIGLCSKGVCLKVTDMSLKRSWKFIQFTSVAQFVVFMKNNIVGTVIVLSLLLWIPASCTVSYIDRKRVSQDQEGIDWHHVTNTLLVPQHEQSGVKIMKTTGTLERTQKGRPAGYEKGRQNTN